MERALIKFNPHESHTSENLRSPCTDHKRKRLWKNLRSPCSDHKAKKLRENLRSPCIDHKGKRLLENLRSPCTDHKGKKLWENLRSPCTDHKRKKFGENLRSPCTDHKRKNLRQNLRSPCTDHKRKRLRGIRDVRNDSLKQNCIPSVSRTTAKNYGNTAVFIDENDHMIDDDVPRDWAIFMAAYSGGEDDDEVDEDFESFFPTYNPNIENDSDEMDEDYKSFLSTFNPDIENDSDEVDEDYESFLSKYNPVSNIENDNDEEDADYRSFLPTYDPDVPIDSTSNHNGGSNIDVDFGKNNEDCGLLNSVMIVNGDEEYMHDMNAAITSQLEDGSNSSDSDLIVLDSYQICQDTPFVPSKIYDSSCFGEAMNLIDNLQTPAYDDSQFRRRLMECLDKPYDLKEYKELIIRLCNRNQKERHFETRRRVVESYRSGGVTTPFHETYPGRSIFS
ncbi:hypothetical protein TSUD_11120 [Trifolium subterraneum]|nr:hypothetical protein TSUD_11120 [Trifolium subterraneum]